jgi:hypothetical protein
MTTFRGGYRFRSPYGRRHGSAGPVTVVAVFTALAAGAGAHAVTHAKPHGQAPHAAAAVTSASEAAFIAGTLADLRAPDNAANADSLAAWFPREYPSWPPWADNNPMSSTMPMPGSWAYNHLPGGGGVQNYPNASEGAQATAATLDDGYYPAIVAALRSGGGICGGGFASELLTWSGNGYSEVC